jgi:hypothetical protein
LIVSLSSGSFRSKKEVSFAGDAMEIFLFNVLLKTAVCEISAFAEKTKELDLMITDLTVFLKTNMNHLIYLFYYVNQQENPQQQPNLASKGNGLYFPVEMIWRMILSQMMGTLGVMEMAIY